VALPDLRRPCVGPRRSRRTRRQGGDALRRDQKAEIIAELEARLRSTSTVLAADFRGLSVKQLSELRGQLRNADAGLTIAKNTLARRAAATADQQALLGFLIGPTGLVWVNGDPAVAAKVLNDASRRFEHLEIKGGLLEGRTLTAAELRHLATLPSREQLLTQLAGGVAAPLRGLAGSLTNVITGLAQALNALHAQRAGEGG
jgi:large subunit ribosomal protein L10